MPDAKNKLYYGDNLAVLRDYIPDQSVDLVYLDPPFNSRQDYNVVFAGCPIHDDGFIVGMGGNGNAS